MKINTDTKERLKVGALFVFQSYKVIMGSLLILFVPQECPENDNNVCSLKNNLTKTDDLFHTVALGFNFLCVFLFMGMYFVELRRENWCVKYFDINHDFPDNNLDKIIDEKPELKLELNKRNKRYFKITALASSVYAINLVLSSIIVYTNYVGIQAVTSYVSYVALILLKIYNSLCISYTSMKGHKALSGFITEFSSFNVWDDDVVEDVDLEDVEKERIIKNTVRINDEPCVIDDNISGDILKPDNVKLNLELEK
tara:strand:- start:112 stop:876 length:765 start_codon:yes stop_codon:yes gene_type:complete